MRRNATEDRKKKIVLSRTQKQENKDGKIRTFVSNLSSLSQDFIQKGSTLFVWDCGKYRSLRASSKAQGKALRTQASMQTATSTLLACVSQ